MRKKLEKTIFFFFAIVAILTFAACSCCKSTTNSTQVSFHEARNYFLNTGKELNVGEKITREKDFNLYFGIAAFMGKDGEATPINFSKSFVLPIVLPETYNDTKITNVSLTGNNSTLHLNYKVEVGAKRSFTIRPIMLLVVNKAYKDAKVVVNQK